MRKNALPCLLAVGALFCACAKEDVFSRWKDPSKYVIKEEVNSFILMQYNIWGASSPWNEARFDAVARVINSQKPDFVTLNEVDSLTLRNPWFQCRELAQRTGMFYAYAVAREHDEWPYASWKYNEGTYGDAVLSRYPIKEVKRFKLYPDNDQGDDGKENRSVCIIKVEIGGRDLWVAATHLDHRSAELSRLYQARQLRSIVESLDGPLVVAGDFNALPTSSTMAIVGEYLTPQYPSTDAEYNTYPSKYNGEKARSMIDYILLRKDDPSLRCLSYRVVNDEASDHCAVVAAFQFNE